MEQSLQKFNNSQNLIEWSERIASCRNSGMSVKDWCQANGIPLSTYYNQQRKVFEASKSSSNGSVPTKPYTVASANGGMTVSCIESSAS